MRPLQLTFSSPAARSPSVPHGSPAWRPLPRSRPRAAFPPPPFLGPTNRQRGGNARGGAEERARRVRPDERACCMSGDTLPADEHLVRLRQFDVHARAAVRPAAALVRLAGADRERRVLHRAAGRRPPTPGVKNRRGRPRATSRSFVICQVRAIGGDRLRPHRHDVRVRAGTESPSGGSSRARGRSR